MTMWVVQIVNVAVEEARQILNEIDFSYLFKFDLSANILYYFRLKVMKMLWQFFLKTEMVKESQICGF